MNDYEDMYDLYDDHKKWEIIIRIKCYVDVKYYPINSEENQAIDKNIYFKI